MMALTGEQKRLLAEPLDPGLVAQREAGGKRMVSYLEGHECISAANRIFGYGAWGHTVDRLDAREVGKALLYTALVSVTVEGCHVHQDIGVGIAQPNRDGIVTADEHDKAVKTAVTDALKRALRVYGDQFGNSLYDRDNEIHDQVKAAHGGAKPAPRPAAPPTARDDFADRATATMREAHTDRERAARQEAAADVGRTHLGSVAAALCQRLLAAKNVRDLQAVWGDVNQAKELDQVTAAEVEALTATKEKLKKVVPAI